MVHKLGFASRSCLYAGMDILAFKACCSLQLATFNTICGAMFYMENLEK